jgi:hypothetical protein
VTTAVLSNVAKDPNGTAVANVVVVARLRPGPGFRADDSEIVGPESTTSDAAGAWSLTLERTTDIDPTGCWWEIEERFPDQHGGPRLWAVALSGDSTLRDALLSSLPAGAGAAQFVRRTGDTMTGPLVLPRDPTAALEAATKAYVDANGGGGAAITVQEEGVSLATAADTLNFVGAAVTASGATGAKTIAVDAARLATTTDAVVYVSAGSKASDSNDGLSWGTAKATLAAAVAAVPATGGVVMVGAGTYNLTATLAVPSNVSIVAAQRRTATIRAAAAIGATIWRGLIEVRDPAGTAVRSNVELRGLVVDANGQNNTTCLTAQGVSNLRLVDCHFKGAGTTAQAVGGVVVIGGGANGLPTGQPTTGVAIRDCEIGPTSTFGLRLTGGSGQADVAATEGVVIEGCHVHDNGWDGIANAMEGARTIWNTTIQRCRFTDNGLLGAGTGDAGHINDANNYRNGWRGLDVAYCTFELDNTSCGGVSDHRGRNIRIHHNSFVGTAFIWTLAIGESNTLPSTSRTRFAWVEDNYFEGAAAADYDSCQDVFIRRNVFYRTIGRPLGSFGDHHRNYIEDNWFIECGQLPHPNGGQNYEKAGISCGPGHTIRRNHFRDDQGTQTMLFGVVELVGGTITGPNVYEDNDFGNIATPILYNTPYSKEVTPGQRTEVATTPIQKARVGAEANDRFTVDAAGKMGWGPGSTAPDASLERNGVGRLHMAQGSLSLGSGGTAPTRGVHSDGTNSYFSAGGAVYLRPTSSGSNANTLAVDAGGTGTRLRFFGTAGEDDTALSRASAGVLRIGSQAIVVDNDLRFTTLTANRQTGTAYTLVLTDAAKVIESDNAGANAVTIPPNSSVAFPVGTVVSGIQYGAGQTTIVAGSGVTLRAPDGLVLGEQYAAWAARKIATDEWEVQVAAAGGGGGTTTITVQDEGVALATGADTLNFVGSTVTASGTGSTKTITVSAEAAGAVAAHEADAVDAHDASAISFAPTGTIAATDVQAAIVEVAAEADSLNDLSDVDTTGLAANTALVFNGTLWVPRAMALLADAAPPRISGTDPVAGTSTDAAKEDHNHGELRLTSPDGTQYRLLVANGGALSTEAIATTWTFGPVVEPQGDWKSPAAFGDDGYALLAWDGGTDVVSMPLNTLTRTVGALNYWTAPTDERGLQHPDAPTDPNRKIGCWYDATAVVATLTFTAAYTGRVRVYMIDWDSTTRRQTLKIDDGSNPAAVDLGGQFDQGMWVGRSVTVGAGGTVVVTATNGGGASPNAVISGIFLDQS